MQSIETNYTTQRTKMYTEITNNSNVKKKKKKAVLKRGVMCIFTHLRGRKLKEKKI